MRLSEAIRLGALLKPQAFGDTFVNGGSCALGAAEDAIGKSLGLDFLQRFFPSVFVNADIACPHCGDVYYFSRVVIHLNDDHRWTREQIADWIETLEGAETADVPAALHVERLELCAYGLL